MGMDVYAGTMTRYFAHNWKTAAQKWAEENGSAAHHVIPDAEETEDELTPDEMLETVKKWQGHMLSALTREGQEAYPSWPEDSEADYYTGKPDWEAFGALLLYAACRVYHRPLPPTVQKGWDFEADPTIGELIDDKKQVWSLFQGVTCWLPIADCFYFGGTLPTGDTAMIGTAAGLQTELDRINAMGWRADEETILSWTDTEGYPDAAAPTQEPTDYNTESLAKYAFSIFWRAVQFSAEHNVPIFLDV